MTTSTCGSCRSTARSTSKPLSPGMRMSVSTTSRGSERMISTAAVPSEAVNTSWARSRTVAMSCSTLGLSSTTKTRARSMSHAPLQGSRKAQGEDRASGGPVVHLDVPAVGPGDGPGDGQAEADPRRLGGEEGLEHPAPRLGADPRAAVRDRHLDHVARGADADLDVAGRPGGLGRVLHQVEHHLA